MGTGDSSTVLVTAAGQGSPGRQAGGAGAGAGAGGSAGGVVLLLLAVLRGRRNLRRGWSRARFSPATD